MAETGEEGDLYPDVRFVSLQAQRSVYKAENCHRLISVETRQRSGR